MPKFLDFNYVTPVTIKNNEPRFITDTLSLRRQSVRTGAQRWELTVGFQGGKADNLLGVLQAHYLRFGDTAFNFAMPQPFMIDTSDTDVYEPTTGTASGSAGSTSVTLSSAGIYPVGWFVKFASHSKIYMVTESNGTSLKIAPALTEDLVDIAVTSDQATDEDDTTGVRIRVQHEISNESITYTQGVLQSANWTFIESLE